MSRIENAGGNLFVRRGKGKRERGDLLLLAAVTGLSLFGLVAVYSASNYSANVTYGDPFFVAKKHLVGLLVGYAAMIFGCCFDYERYEKTGIFALAGAIVLLLLVFTPLGYENYGAKRWISLGGITVQPSELAKIAFILFAAGYLSKKPERAESFRGVFPVLLAGGGCCLLVLAEPNMSVAVCFAILTAALLFIGGMKIRHFAVVALPAILAIPLLIAAEPYRLRRLSAFLDPWASPKGEGYQLLQSLYALGSGGWFGVGAFRSRQKFRFLPFSESDFILAVIGEEYGFFGLVVLFALMAFIVIRGLSVAARAETLFGYFLAGGISCIYAIQTLVNILVVTGSIPPTGLPLPLVSAGNTSLIVFLFSFGVLYNVSRRRRD